MPKAHVPFHRVVFLLCPSWQRANSLRAGPKQLKHNTVQTPPTPLRAQAHAIYQQAGFGHRVLGWSQSVRVQNTKAEDRVGLQPLPKWECLVPDALGMGGNKSEQKSLASL